MGIIRLGYLYATTREWVLKRQIQWIIWGLACATVAVIADLVLTWLQKHTTYSAALLLSLGANPLLVGVAFAILRYRRRT